MTARPGAELWGSAATLGVMGASFAWLSLWLAFQLPNAQPADKPFVLGLGALLFLLLIGMALWMVCASAWEVTANTDGVTWRTWRGSKRATWDEVSDFYTRVVGGGSAATERAYVVTGAGTLWFTARWRNGDPLKDFVARHATDAPVRSWGAIGTRPSADFPQTFGYQRATYLQSVGFLAVGVVMGIVALVFLVAPMAFLLNSGPGRIWGVLLFVLYALTLGVFPGLLGAVYLPLVLDARRRRGETITVEREGLVWATENNALPIFIAWRDIADYGITESKGGRRGGCDQFIVHATNEKEIIFSSALERHTLVAEIIAQEAANSRARHIAGGNWRPLPYGPGFAGNAGFTSKTHVYHYRLRSYRAGLWSVWVYPLLFLSLFALDAFEVTKIRSDVGGEVFVGVVGLIMAVGAAWTTWRYYSARVETNYDGITQYTAFGRKKLRWKDMTDYDVKSSAGFRFLIVRGTDGIALRFWEGISEADELKAEIARRAPRPVHGWGDGSAGDTGVATDAKHSRASRA